MCFIYTGHNFKKAFYYGAKQRSTVSCVFFIICTKMTKVKMCRRWFGLSTNMQQFFRMLEQLRKLQGSVLHPDYSSPFCSFEDTLCRLLPYHLYQGVAPSPQDYHKGKRFLCLYDKIYVPFKKMR